MKLRIVGNEVNGYEVQVFHPIRKEFLPVTPRIPSYDEAVISFDRFKKALES